MVEKQTQYTYFEFLQDCFPRDFKKMQEDPEGYELEEAQEVIERHRVKETMKPLLPGIKGGGRQTMTRDLQTAS